FTAGAEALQRGDAQTARQLLEESLRSKPDHQRARNLLGLSLFKLGELVKAERIYRSLLEENPADTSLRVNLGLVFLKAGAASDATRCFETALDLSPDHKKAQNYLGLALAQKGELARAREWFLKSGNAAMAERMERELAASPLREVAQKAEGALSSPRPFKSALEPGESVPAKGAEEGASWGQLALKPELKRFHGKPTDKFFGEGGRRMLRASGAGRFIISREGRTFTALELGDEPAYFREETLFAFEESIVFENGRVPSR